MKAYSVGPIDFYWEMLPTIEEVLAKLPLEDHCDWDMSKYDFLNKYELAKDAAREVFWEGDMQEEARVLFVPADGEFEIGFVWKQGNNGTTFLIFKSDTSISKLAEELKTQDDSHSSFINSQYYKNTLKKKADAKLAVCK